MELNPEFLWGSAVLAIGLALTMHGCALLIEWFYEWKYFKSLGDDIGNRLILTDDDRAKRAAYNPKEFRT